MGLKPLKEGSGEATDICCDLLNHFRGGKKVHDGIFTNIQHININKHFGVPQFLAVY